MDSTTATARFTGTLPAGFIRYPSDGVGVLASIKDERDLWAFVASERDGRITVSKYRGDALIACVASVVSPLGKHVARFRREGDVVICEMSVGGETWTELHSAVLTREDGA